MAGASFGRLVPEAKTTDSLTTDSPHTATGALGGSGVTTDQVAPPLVVRSSRRFRVKVPTQPTLALAKATERRYTPGAECWTTQVSPPSSVLMMLPSLLTAQPTRGSTNQISSVRELAVGAFVRRQVGAIAARSASSSRHPSSIHISIKAISEGDSESSPEGMRLNVASTGASGRSAPKGGCPLSAFTRLEPAPSPTAISGSPNTFRATKSLRVVFRQNAPWNPTEAFEPPTAPSRTSITRWNLVTSSPPSDSIPELTRWSVSRSPPRRNPARSRRSFG